jgi:hypothetical protein
MTETIDVSDVVWLRRRLARGALATRIAALKMSFTSGLIVSGFSQAAFSDTNPLVVIAVMLLVAVLGFRLASAFQRGSRSTAWTLVGLLVPYTAIYVFGFSYYNGLFNLITGLPIYFIAMAGFGLLSRRGSRARGLAATLNIDPYRSGLRQGRARPAFGNKLSWGMYVFLALTVFAALLPLLVSISDSATTALEQGRSTSDVPRETARSFGGDIARKLVGLWVAPTGPDADPARDFGALLGSLFLPALLVTFLYRRARRHAVVRATDVKRKRGGTAPILYLRSFRDDKLKMRARAANGRGWLETVLRVGFEEVAVDHLWRLGDVIAIGKPGDKAAPLGAARDWVPGDDWQTVVEDLSGRASLIVLVIGRTEGVGWELERLMEARCLDKVVLLVPPVGAKELEDRWSTLTGRLASRGGFGLSTTLNIRRVRAIVFPGGGAPRLLTASDRDDWSYETVLDAAALSILDPQEARPEHAPTPVQMQLAARAVTR